MSRIRDAAVNHSTTNVTVVTTTEKVIVSSGVAKTPRETHQVVVLAWGQFTSGAAMTAVTPRVRRGTTITGTLVGEATAEDNKADAAETEPFFIMVSEQRSGEESVEYSLTLQQTDATGNGTVVQSAILVLVL